MRILLDTHAFIWWFQGNTRLPSPARQVIADDANDVLVSAATAWEIATKHRLGKLPDAEALAIDIPSSIVQQSFEELPVTVAEGVRAGELPGPLRDPFDRMLIAQALTHDLIVVSNETLFDRYGVRRLW